MSEAETDPKSVAHQNDRKLLRTATRLVYAYPAFWLLGFAGLFWPVLGIAATVYLLRAKLTAVSWLLIALAGSLTISIPVGLVQFGFLPARVLGAGANILVWVAVAALVNVVRSVNCATQLRAGIAYVALVQGALTTVSALMHPVRLPVPIFSGVDLLGSGFRAFSRNTLFVESWLGETAFRSAGIMAQPTWAGAVGALGVICGISLLRSTTLWMKSFAVAAVVFGAVSVHYSLSRAVEIGLFAALAICVITGTAWRSSTSGRDAIYSLGILSVAFLVLFGWQTILAKMAEINGQREGSLITRSAIYAKTWEYISELRVPLAGFGVKPQVDYLVASVATHSTLLGLVFRGGIIALALYVVILVAALRIAAADRNLVGVALVVFISLWTILEDFDPGHLVPLGLVVAFAGSTKLRDDIHPESMVKPKNEETQSPTAQSGRAKVGNYGRATERTQGTL